MAYVLPVPSYNGLSSWQAHINRGTPSSEPGTDLYVPRGTPVYAPASGEIWGSGQDINPPTGRWVGINFYDGRSFRAMHHSQLVRTSGTVKAGELIAYSGSSGYGSEYFGEPYENNAFWNNTGGPHTHVTLWPTHDHRYGYKSPGVPYTIDFMDYVGSGSGAGSSTGDDFMSALSDDQVRQIYDALVVNGGAYYKTDAIINILREEIAKQVGDVRNALKARNSDGTAFLGYDMLPAILNQNSAQDKQLATILSAVQAGGITNEQIGALAKAIATEVIDALPEGGSTAPSAAEVAGAVRDILRTDPLK